MYARVSTFRVPADRIDEDASRTGDVTDRLKDIPGFAGVYYLVDRESGKTISVTLWDNEQAMRASEEQAMRVREETTADVAGEVLSVERYEVALQPSDVMASR